MEGGEREGGLAWTCLNPHLRELVLIRMALTK